VMVAAATPGGPRVKKMRRRSSSDSEAAGPADSGGRSLGRLAKRTCAMSEAQARWMDMSLNQVDADGTWDRRQRPPLARPLGKAHLCIMTAGRTVLHACAADSAQ